MVTVWWRRVLLGAHHATQEIQNFLGPGPLVTPEGCKAIPHCGYCFRHSDERLVHVAEPRQQLIEFAVVVQDASKDLTENLSVFSGHDATMYLEGTFVNTRVMA